MTKAEKELRTTLEAKTEFCPFVYEILPLDDLIGVSGDIKVMCVKGKGQIFEPNGAWGIFEPDIREKLLQMFGGSCIIIPSSIHEVLAMAEGAQTTTELTHMIRSINETVVKPEDQLSDHAYILTEDGLEDYTTEAERKRVRARTDEVLDMNLDTSEILTWCDSASKFITEVIAYLWADARSKICHGIEEDEDLLQEYLSSNEFMMMVYETWKKANGGNGNA